MEDQHTPSTISTHYQMDRSSSKSQPDKCESSVMSLMNDSNAFAAISQIDLTNPQHDLSKDNSIPLTNGNQRQIESPAMNRYMKNDSTSMNGPGLAKPILNISTDEVPGKTRIDAALEKNLQNIATQIRRTNTNSTSQLTRNDLNMFDSTSSMTNSQNLGNSREMTPDSIIDETPIAAHARPLNLDFPPAFSTLTWPPAPLYPFAGQHPGLFYPYGPLPSTNGPLPSFYPSMIDQQQFNVQSFAAFYNQQQAAARLFQEHPSLSDNFSSVLPVGTTTTAAAAMAAVAVGAANTREQTEKFFDSSCEMFPLFPNQLNYDHRSKKTSVNNSQSYVSSHHLTINEQFSRLSPDLSSDGDGGVNNDADSIISIESQKSNTMPSMPVLEDGLSDSEQQEKQTNDERSTSVRSKVKDSSVKTTRSTSHETQIKSGRSTGSSVPTVSEHPSFRLQQDSSTVQTDYDTDEETDKLLSIEHRLNARNQAIREAAMSRPRRRREVQTRVIPDPENSSVLIEGVLFRCRYLGSTQLTVDANPSKVSRMMQAQEVVELIKAPDGEHQPSVEVDLFVSTEKIMVLNTDLEDIIMDHSLRSISYIADIGDLVVLMAKRRYLQDDERDEAHGSSATSSRRMVTFNQKMICHVLESDEAQSIAHSIGHAFQVAYIDFLKANGIDDPSFTQDIDYQEVLDQQEMASEELERFARKECQKEAIVTKAKNEPLGIVIVESGWGSMLPTVVIANMMPGGPAARGGHLNIGDQIISVNGISLVGLPLSSCQTQIKNIRHLTTVRLVVVPCPPVVEVFIRRPDTKYQLGFSVQNGIICSLLRGGIAERGGVRVGHRIIEINGHSVVATSHDRIVNMLTHSVGELRMKTMPTQMYRLLTGQETPIYI